MPKPNPEVELLEEVVAVLQQLLVVLQQLLAATLKVAKVSQVTCPVCNAPLALHRGPYLMNSEGLFIHQQCIPS